MMTSMMKRMTGAGILLGLSTVAMAGKPSTPFVKNAGQWKEPFEYKAECGNLALFVERNALTWRMWQSDFDEVVHEGFHHPGSEPALRGHAWRTRFIGADPARIEASGPASHYFNYFIGNDPARWRSRVPVYAEVKHTGLWPGVDLRLYRKDGHYEYDMMIAAGTNASVIRMGYEGLDGMRINKDGELVLVTSLGELRETAPKAFYADGAQEALACVFTLNGTEVGFAFPKGRNAKRPVIIDPFLVASTLTGTGDIGTTQNYGHTATYDDDGNIYTGAICFGQGYPTTVGAFEDTFAGGGVDFGISKLNPDGSDLLYATYIGGNGADHPHSMVVTPQNELCVYGTSNAGDFPTTANAYSTIASGGTDIVVSKLTIDGTTLVGSTFLGTAVQDGNNQLTFNYGDGYRGEVISDVDGDIIVSSCTQGAFPTTAGAFQETAQGGQDGVVFRLNSDLSVLEWSTILGTSGDDMAFGVKLDGTGGVYVGGATDSPNFPTTVGAYQTTSGGGQDAFIAHITTDGTVLAQSTYFGGAGEDPAFFLQMDGSGNAYIYGQTDQGSIDIAPAGTYGVAGGFIFVAKFSPDLSQNIFRTTHGDPGGFGNCVPVAFLVDLCDHIYISGYSTSGSEFPASQDALYSTGGFYLACYQSNMTGLLYATYYEGAGHVDGGTSRFDDDGIVYQAVCTSGGFPTTPNAWSSNQPAGWDLGVFKIDFEQDEFSVSIGTEDTTGCAPAEFLLTGQGAGDEYLWDLDDGGPLVSGDSVVVSYDTPGVYTVIMIGTNTGSCSGTDTTTITLTVYDPSQIDPAFTAIPNSSCAGYSVTLDNTTTNGVSYLWEFGNGDTSSVAEPGTIPYDEPGEYTIILNAFDPVCANAGTETIVVDIPPATMPYDLATPIAMCEGVTVVLNAGAGYDSYDWEPGANTQTITVSELGWYVSTVTDGVCTGVDSIEVVQAFPHAPLGDRVVCPNDSSAIGPPYEIQQILWSNGLNTQYIEVNEGIFWFVATDDLGCIVRDTIMVERIPATEGDDFVPNVFSPNGDGKNDLFEVKANGLMSFSMMVFNRWGMKMYETNDWTNGWNGKRDNTQDHVPDGTYFYIIDYQDHCTSQDLSSKHGHVTLLR